MVTASELIGSGAFPAQASRCCICLDFYVGVITNISVASGDWLAARIPIRERRASVALARNTFDVELVDIVSGASHGGTVRLFGTTDLEVRVCAIHCLAIEL